MFLQCTANLPNYFEFYQKTLEILEDEKCGLVGDVCQLAKRSGAHERRKGKETRSPEKYTQKLFYVSFVMRLLHHE